MRSWFLGGFLARRSRLATRYLAAVAGLSLAVALCLLSGVLQFLDRSAEKADARQFGPEVAAGCTVGVTRSDQFDQRSYQRGVIGRVLRPRCDDEFAVPPGLTRFPSPGEVFVSPALAELRGAEPALAERFPVITGTIGPDGLLASNELSVIVGGRRDVFDRAFNVATFDRFGASIDWITTYFRTEPATLRNIGILFCVPLSIWLIYVATSVNARVRRRQLGVLAVVGLVGWAPVGRLSPRRCSVSGLAPSPERQRRSCSLPARRRPSPVCDRFRATTSPRGRRCCGLCLWSSRSPPERRCWQRFAPSTLPADPIVAHAAGCLPLPP